MSMFMSERPITHLIEVIIPASEASVKPHELLHSGQTVIPSLQSSSASVNMAGQEAGGPGRTILDGAAEEAPQALCPAPARAVSGACRQTAALGRSAVEELSAS